MAGALAGCAARAPAPGDPHADATTQRTPAIATRTVIIAPQVVDSMKKLFLTFNRHWDETGNMNTLTQMLGTGGPTQREFLGCLQGAVQGDTLWVNGWARARNMKQLQFAVAGDCEETPSLVGTWHTHPYRLGLDGSAQKERELSAEDLRTFGRDGNLIMIAVWDADSMDVAVREADGWIQHPAPFRVGTRNARFSALDRRTEGLGPGGGAGPRFARAAQPPKRSGIGLSGRSGSQ